MAPHVRADIDVHIHVGDDTNIGANVGANIDSNVHPWDCPNV